MTTETIHWHAVGDCLPDADTTVLVRFAPGTTGEPVWLASFDGTDWHDIEGFAQRVTHWAEMPAGPQEDKVAGRIGRDPDLLPLANGRSVDFSGAWAMPV